jgi:hypothetical protein
VRRAVVCLYGAIGAVLVGGCAVPRDMAMMEVVPVTRIEHGTAQSQGYYEVGRYYQNQNRADVAIAAFRKALALDAGLVDAHNALGVIYAAQGGFDAARVEFGAAIALASGVAILHNNLGYALYLQGDAAAAIEALEKATALDPSNPRTLNNLALALARARAFESARSGDAPTPRAGFAVAPAGPRPGIRGNESFAGASGDPPGSVSTAAGPGTSVTAISSNAQVFTLAPNVIELRWAAPTLIARPAAAAEIGAGVPDRVEVSNGNGVTDMARKVAVRLQAVGVAVTRLTNQEPYVQHRTEIQYREGHQAAAIALGRRLPDGSPLVRSDRLRADVDVRLVLGHDLARDLTRVDASIAGTRWVVAAPATDLSVE